MRISIHQPAYLPWLGYFDKIFRSDLFIILDTVQFQKNSYQNRNKILSKNGTITLTLPIQLDKYKIIKNAKILNNNWQKKHIDSIFFNYNKAKYFEKYFESLKKFYSNKCCGFNDYTYEMLIYFCKILNIETKIIKLSSEKEIDGNKGDLILNICKYFKADTYLSGINGQNYLDLNSFNKNNIKIEFQKFKSQKYKQIHSDVFVPNLSIIDYIMNSKI